MAKNHFQKPESELELIKSALSSDLDESSVDIYAQDLFAAPKPEKKETPPPEPAPQHEEKIKEAAPEPEPEKKTAPKDEGPEEPKKEEKEKQSEERPAEKTAPRSVMEDSSPGELKAERDVEEMDLNIETGELKSLAATKEAEKLDETEESLTQLEKMTDDFMSVKEVKKLYKNMNLMIDMLNLFMVRLDSIERQLKKKGILKDK
jgi:hypothetical protein